METVHFILTGALIVQFVVIAAIDIWRLKIMNWSVYSSIVLLLAWQATRPGGFDLTAVYFALILFAIAFTLWLLRMFGGGDAKALPLCGLAAGFGTFSLMFFSLAMATLVMIVVWTALKLLVVLKVPFTDAVKARISGRKLPFGTPIAAASVAAIVAQSPQIFG